MGTLDSIIAYMKLAHPTDWQDYVFYPANSTEPIAVMFPSAGTLYHAPTRTVYRMEKATYRQNR